MAVPKKQEQTASGQPPRLAAAFPHKALFVRLFGRDVYAVGGFVRDLVMGRPTAEVDILVARHPLDDIVRKIRPHGSVDLVGRSFGIIKFTADGLTYDVAMPRKEIARDQPTRRHQDFEVDFDPAIPVEKDLERRDFRCNSLALRLRDGALIDPFGGLADIRARFDQYMQGGPYFPLHRFGDFLVVAERAKANQPGDRTILSFTLTARVRS